MAEDTKNIQAFVPGFATVGMLESRARKLLFLKNQVEAATESEAHPEVFQEAYETARVRLELTAAVVGGIALEHLKATRLLPDLSKLSPPHNPDLYRHRLREALVFFNARIGNSSQDYEYEADALEIVSGVTRLLSNSEFNSAPRTAFLDQVAIIGDLPEPPRESGIAAEVEPQEDPLVSEAAAPVSDGLPEEPLIPETIAESPVEALEKTETREIPERTPIEVEFRNEEVIVGGKSYAYRSKGASKSAGIQGRIFAFKRLVEGGGLPLRAKDLKDPEHPITINKVIKWLLSIEGKKGPLFIYNEQRTNNARYRLSDNYEVVYLPNVIDS